MPSSGRTDNPFSDVLDRTRKYVASRTLKEPLPWQNSTWLGSEALEAVGYRKKEQGNDLIVLGSGELIQALARAARVDEYRIAIHPLVLGTVRRLFPEGSSGGVDVRVERRVPPEEQP